jgi:hypothetical protein
MQLLYLAAFLTGLVLGVYAMIRGVERIGSGRSLELDALGRPLGSARMALSAPIFSAFATVFGITAISCGDTVSSPSPHSSPSLLV